MLVFFALCGLVGLVAGQNRWFNPPAPDSAEDYTNNPVWELGSVEELSWITDLGVYNLTLHQEGLDEKGAIHHMDVLAVAGGTNGGGDEASQMRWVVEISDLTLADSNVFYFGIHNDPVHFTSHYINITERSNTASAIQSSRATSSSASATNSGNTTVPAISATQPPPPSNTDSTKSTSIGLGVGLGLGLPIAAVLGALAALMFLKRRAQRVVPLHHEPLHDVKDPNGGVYSMPELPNKNTVAELSSSGERMELSNVEP